MRQVALAGGRWLVYAAAAVAVATAVGSIGSGDSGAPGSPGGLEVIETSNVQVQTAFGVSFWVRQKVMVSNHTPSSVRAHKSELRLQVTGYGSGGETLICTGVRISSKYYLVGAAQGFDPLLIPDGVFYSYIYDDHTTSHDKGTEGFEFEHNAADYLVYYGLNGGPTCQGGAAPPQGTGFYSIPGWWTRTPPGQTNWYQYYRNCNTGVRPCPVTLGS